MSDRLGIPASELTAAQRIRLARLVAKPRSRAGQIDADNSLVGWTTIEQAVEEGASYFVEVRRLVLACDFDNEDGENAESEARKLCSRLIRDGFAPVLLASGRPGHFHVFCLVPPDQRSAILSELNIRNKRVRNDIRPPGTPSQRGGEVTLLLPRDADVAEDRLEGVARLRRLGSGGRYVLRSRSLPANKSVSERAMSLAMSAVNAGWTVDDFLMVCSDPDVGFHQVLELRIEHRGREETFEWLAQQVWPEAVSWVRDHPATASAVGSSLVGRLLAWAVAHPWPGATGSSDWAVYCAMLKQHALCRKAEFNLSERDVCLLAGIGSRDTARAAASRLVEKGLLRQVDANHMRYELWHMAKTWELITPSDIDQFEPLPNAEELLNIVGSDVFRNRIGLNHRAEQAYLTLAVTGESMTAAQLSSRTGASVRHTRRVLADLLDVGLVVKDGVTRWAIGGQLLEVAAKEIGVDGRGAAQAELHQRQRQARDLLVSQRSAGQQTSQLTTGGGHHKTTSS